MADVPPPLNKPLSLSLSLSLCRCVCVCVCVCVSFPLSVSAISAETSVLPLILRCVWRYLIRKTAR